MTARRQVRQRRRRTIVEMTWMETIRLLGVDLLAVLLIVVVALDRVEHLVHLAGDSKRKHR